MHMNNSVRTIRECTFQHSNKFPVRIYPIFASKLEENDLNIAAIQRETC